jgi:phosphotransferase system HPr-like phosphotransfer protein
VCNGLLESSVEQWTQRQLVHLYRSATEVESYLDGFGARKNRTFFRVREVIACVRWLAHGTSSLVHLHGNMSAYDDDQRAWAEDKLEPRVTKAAIALGNILFKVLQGLSNEWVKAGLEWPNGALRVESIKAGPGLVHLPNDRLEDRGPAHAVGTQPHGVRCANRLLVLARGWSSQATKEVIGLEERQVFMANYCTEVIARRFEARVHNLRSTYDTWVAGTDEEQANPGLMVIRATVSEVLALLETVTALTHLYERHDIYERNGESQRLFESLVDKEELLGLIINDGVAVAYDCLQRAVPVAEAVMEQLAVKQSIQLELAEGLAMHARPLSLIVGIVQKNGTPIEITVAGQTCTAESMMQMLVLVGTYPDERRYEFTGDPKALRDIELLFQHRLGEDGFDDFPAELGYLRP